MPESKWIKTSERLPEGDAMIIPVNAHCESGVFLALYKWHNARFYYLDATTPVCIAVTH